VLLFMVVSEALETTLVSAIADRPVTDVASYFAVRNSSAMLGSKVAYNTLAAILAGYMTAKIAGGHEVRYAAVAAVIQTASLGWGFTMGEYAAFTPAWMRWVVVLTTGPAMLLGAFVRKSASQKVEQVES
jgi:heme/copper-type cytochrome/quinol oxidase subunit 3